MARKRQARRCSGKRASDGAPCGAWAINGGTVCQAHGGRAPQVKAKARENLADARLDRLVRMHEPGSAAVGDPLEALQRLASRAIALEEAIGRMVNNLGEEIRWQNDHGEQLRSEVAVLERAMDRCGRLLVDIAKLNIEERLAKVTELQTKMAADALAATMREMGLSREQQQDARKRVARHLRAA